ncbi:MAG: hypothetical protein AB7G28_01930 [Pirellulales bacterium]
MRSSVAVALVVCGTLFALLPVASDYYHGYQVSQFLADRTIARGVTRIHQPFGETFRASAWVLGGVMIGLGAIGGAAPEKSGASRRGQAFPEKGELRRDMLTDGDWRAYERVQVINS